MTCLPAVAVAAAAACALSACGGEDDKYYAANVDPETTPTMTTRKVNTLISDSGVLRYRITAPVWYVYDEARDPRWTFPRTIHLEQFDNEFKQDATIDCDSATYFSDRMLWRLDGHVTVVNLAGDRFLTPQLFWDQKRKLVYSDTFIQVIRPDRIMEGYGFESNENMTRFKVLDVSAILPVSQFRGGDSTASAPADTLAAPADAPAAPADSADTSPAPRRPQRAPRSRPVRPATQQTAKPQQII